MAYCWRMIRGNFVEARGEISELVDFLRYSESGEMPDGVAVEDLPCWLKRWKTATEYTFFVSMEHAYHHINFGWNCRAFPEKRVIECVERDFRRWEKFPHDWLELFPSVKSCVGKPRQIRNGKINFLSMRIPLDEVMATLDNVIAAIDRFGTCSGVANSDVSQVLAKDLRDQIRHIYLYMNEAWNTRKMTMERKVQCSAATARRRCQFPCAFERFWN